MLIYICEDSESDVVRLRHFLSSYAKIMELDFEIVSFSLGTELCEDYRRTLRRPELIFLDIYMVGMDGMATARELRRAGYRGGVIFTTSSTEHAMDSYEVNALYYLQKPYRYENFADAMERCRPLFLQAQQSFTFRHKRQEMSVPYRDILFFETGLRHTVLLYTVSGTFSFIGSLSQIAEDFRQRENFVPVGRSYLINLNHVAGRRGNDLVMSDNSIVQIPLRRQEDVLSAVERWRQNASCARR